MNDQLAQGIIIQPSVGPLTPTARPIAITGPLQNINTLADLVNILLTFLVPMAGIILFFVIIWGGYDLLLSQGDPERVQSGKNKITSGIIGMVPLVLSFLIARIIGYIFGVGDGII